ncbi:hypothetical protein [Phyllobacterium myrsinacearum]|uniref:EF-hand domain-containing protein n=1 Tax=Phyllobacterium myrsinacearum TaxID=28101 RepID=A0A839EEV9_9HYPH|nr:hypothetical protein [Phyllobacterium myrsinacearum]MBA8877462.1 hypothetical protein [Phyllobacterium myrsinacearum]
MKNNYLFIFGLIAIGLTGAAPAQAGSYRLSVPVDAPAKQMILKVDDKPGSPAAGAPLKLDAKIVQDAVNQQLKNHFDRAASPSGQLTANAAKAAGWGFISDHFQEIDRDNKGYVSYADVSAFMKARSPLKVPASMAKPGDKAVQIIE